jgi:hypothetical protein
MTHHSTSVNMKKALSRERRGFTLVEMVVVVAITIALMAIMLPALKGLRGSKQSFAATTQFIGDLSTARLMAMNNGSPVYVVFMPLAGYINDPSLSPPPSCANPKPYFELLDGGNPRLGGQLVSYAFYAEYVLGDSLGSPSRRWLSDWKQLPEGAFFPSEMLGDLMIENKIFADAPGNDRLLIPHIRNNGPSSGTDMILPYIGFDARGRLIGVMGKPNDQGAIIRLVEGGVLPPEKDPSTDEYLWDDATGFNADEPSNIGRVENYVLINFQTGRARTTVIKAVPAGNKLVKVRIIRFTDRLWKDSDQGWDGPKGFGEELKLYVNASAGRYNNGWKVAYRLIEGQQVLKDGRVAPPVVEDIPANLASKLQGIVLRRDPDAEFLIE